jgi:hypothetical protein
MDPYPTMKHFKTADLHIAYLITEYSQGNLADWEAQALWELFLSQPEWYRYFLTHLGAQHRFIQCKS